MSAMPQTQDPAVMRDNIGIYVTCSDFCGLRIYDGDQDHAAGCGAPDDEKARLLRELGAMKIKAASAETEIAEVTWRCSCGEEFPSQDDLAGHHTTTQHIGMWMVEENGDEHEVTPNEQEVEVNGERAKLRKSPKREQIRDEEKPPWEDPFVELQSVYDAQRAIDDGAHVLGGLPAGKKCPGRRVILGIEVSCPHLVAMRTVETETCDHERKHTKTVHETCLIHGILLFAEGLAPAGNGPLFGE